MGIFYARGLHLGATSIFAPRIPLLPVVVLLTYISFTLPYPFIFTLAFFIQFLSFFGTLFFTFLPPWGWEGGIFQHTPDTLRIQCAYISSRLLKGQSHQILGYILHSFWKIKLGLSAGPLMVLTFVFTL